MEKNSKESRTDSTRPKGQTNNNLHVKTNKPHFLLVSRKIFRALDTCCITNEEQPDAIKLSLNKQRKTLPGPSNGQGKGQRGLQRIGGLRAEICDAPPWSPIHSLANGTGSSECQLITLIETTDILFSICRNQLRVETLVSMIR